MRAGKARLAGKVSLRRWVANTLPRREEIRLWLINLGQRGEIGGRGIFLRRRLAAILPGAVEMRQCDQSGPEGYQRGRHLYAGQTAGILPRREEMRKCV